MSFCNLSYIPVLLKSESQARVVLRNVLGATIEVIHDGALPQGESKLFFDASALSSGAYVVTLELENGFSSSQNVMVK